MFRFCQNVDVISSHWLEYKDSDLRATCIKHPPSNALTLSHEVHFVKVNL